MSCLITSGQNPIPCKTMNGINTVYIGNWSPTLTYVLNSDGITIGTFSAGTTSFYTFLQNPEVASYDAPATLSGENNAYKFTQNALFDVYNLTATNIKLIRTLAQTQNSVILLDNNGLYYMMGIQLPALVSAMAGGLGKAGNDKNGYAITITSIANVPITPLASTAALQVITA